MRKLQFFREGGSEKHVRDIRSMIDQMGDSLNLDSVTEITGWGGIG